MEYIYRTADKSVDLGLGSWLEYNGLQLNKRDENVLGDVVAINYSNNPKAQNNTDGVSLVTAAGMVGGSAIFERVACTWDNDSDYCFQWGGTQPNDSIGRSAALYVLPTGSNGLPIAPGDVFTVSAYLNAVDQSGSTRGIRWVVAWYDGVNLNPIRTDSQVEVDDANINGTRLAYTPPPAPAGAAFMHARLTHLTSTPNDSILMEATRIQIERGSVATPYFDGDSQEGTWRGTEGNSTSNRHQIGTAAEIIRVSEIDGIGDPDIRDSREVNPGAHGETPFESWYGGRTITITGSIEAGNLAMLRKMTDDLKTAFGSLQENFLYFRNHQSAFDAKILCRKNAPINIKEAQTSWQFKRDFQISLRASNPFFLSADDLVAEQRFEEVVKLGFFFDFRFDLLFAEYMNPNGEPIDEANPFAIENAGNFSTYPIIRIHGPVTNPSIVNIANDQTLKLDTGITAGDFYEIDTRKRTVIDSYGNNRFAQISSNSDWMVLESGSNLLLVNGESIDEASRVEIIYNHTWI